MSDDVYVTRPDPDGQGSPDTNSETRIEFLHVLRDKKGAYFVTPQSHSFYDYGQTRYYITFDPGCETFGGLLAVEQYAAREDGGAR